ncbi:MAG: quinolinate synthase NadA [Planctomycetota bacterium]
MMKEKLKEKIEKLKNKRKAVILAHNYQPADIQELADFTGDSLGLSIEASKTEAETIVFCGVHFMAETAAILSPDKTVLLPDKNAGCPMADMATAEDLLQIKQKHTGAVVVCYVNSSAKVKAISDYCCTSSNAVEVVESLPADKEIIFVPDQHLGQYVAEKTGRKLIFWPGYCPSHIVITEEELLNSKSRFPDAVVMAHPECSEPVKELADELLSTGQMMKYARQSDANCFIVATESGMIYALKKVRPDAEFIPASEKAVCLNMKKITIDKIITSLEDMKYIIKVDEPVRQKARISLDRMVQILPKA